MTIASTSLGNKQGSQEVNKTTRMACISAAWKAVTVLIGSSERRFTAIVSPYGSWMETQIILLDLVNPSRNRQCSEFPKTSMNNLTKRRDRA